MLNRGWGVKNWSNLPMESSKKLSTHSVVVSLWDVPEPLYIKILRSDGPQKRLADVDLTHLKSYWVIHTISIAALGHSKSLWAIYFVSSHPKSSWVIKTSYVRGPPIQNPIYCDSVVTTTTVCNAQCTVFCPRPSRKKKMYHFNKRS